MGFIDEDKDGDKKMLYAVILAGGKGERFWPLSRQLDPKQFLKVITDKTLIQETISRIKPEIPKENIYIVTNYSYLYELKKQIKDFGIPDKNIFLEPLAKNTAPSVGWVAMHLISKDPSSIMVVLPSDHLIFESKKFLATLKKATRLAKIGHLVTLGVIPQKAHTGYGYIKIGRKMNKLGFRIDKFIEKPTETKAVKFLKDKRYFWNSGIFIWKVNAILEEIKQYLPSLYNKLLELKDSKDIEKIWKYIPSISIDYGILEKSKNVAMVKANFDWTDLGSWERLYDILPKDKSKNIFKADALDIGSKNIFVWGGNRLIATIGLRDLFIVDTPDALLVCDKEESEKVKNVVELLKDKGRQEHLLHKTVKRPWGRYTVLEMQRGFKIKLVEIEPGHRLSLQLHKKRAEHWVVIEGKAKVTYDSKVKYIYPNQSIFISTGRIHRLENPGKFPLKIVEVQTGRYLEENDIIRIKDDYKRR